MILLFTKVRIGLHFPGDELKKNAIMVLLIPLTVLSVVFALEIALLGNKVFIVEELVKFATEAATNDILYNFLVLTPVRISIHALLTFLITLELEVQYNPPAMPFEEDVE